MPPLKAEPAAQRRLLDLQATDTALAQLTHRRATLPQLAALRESEARRDELRGRVAELQAKRGDLEAEQKKLENEIDGVRARAVRDDQRLTAGGLPSKELEGLQREIESLKRRQSVLEDDELELMEQVETIDRQIAELDAELVQITEQRATLEAARDGAFAEMDATEKEKQAQHVQIATEIPQDLLALYEKVRASSGGVGAAALRQRRCDGCRIELAGSELSAVRVAAPDAVIRCENCRRILVRTEESGL